MNKVWLVAKWEFWRFFKPKQELIGYLVMLGIFAFMWSMQSWQAVSSKSYAHLAVEGTPPAILQEHFKLQSVEGPMPENVHHWLDEQELDGWLQTHENTGEYTLYVSEASGWQSTLESVLHDYHQQQILAQLQLSREQLEAIQNPVVLDVVSAAEATMGSEFKSLTILVLVLVSVGVFMSFGLALTSVTTEKMQRITEQLLTCVTPQQWIDGKTLGLCLMSVKSMVTSTLTFLLVFAGISMFKSGSMAVGFALPWTLATQIVLFAVLGVLFWNYLYTGFAATIDDPNHSGKTGVMLLPAVPVMLVFSAMGEPNGQMATILSIVPLTSISFMPMRLASMDVPMIQYLLSLMFLVLSVVLMRLFATRVFRANIGLYGKEPSWAEIWRAMLDK